MKIPNDTIQKVIDTPTIRTIQTIYTKKRQHDALRRLNIITHIGYLSVIIACLNGWSYRWAAISATLYIGVYIWQYSRIQYTDYLHETRRQRLTLEKQPLLQVACENGTWYMQKQTGRPFEAITQDTYHCETPHAIHYTLKLGKHTVYEFVTLPTKNTFFV